LIAAFTMNELVTWLENVLGLQPEIQGNLFASLVTLLVIWLARILFVHLALRRVEDAATSYRWRKTASTFSFVLSSFLLAWIWFPDGLRDLSTFLGLLSAGLAIALQGPLVDIAGWIFILWRRSFKVSDRIQIGENAGDVIDIRIFQFTILEIGNWVDADQGTGRVIHIPNGLVFKQSLANYTRGFQYIWNEIPVRITFESNWQKAKTILQQIAEKHGSQFSEAARQGIKAASRKYLIFYAKLTPTVYTSVTEYGILLTIRYLCPPRMRRGSAEAIWEDVLIAFEQNADITFAYPT
jgi:small-conductance mechanosensitive channel